MTGHDRVSNDEMSARAWGLRAAFALLAVLALASTTATAQAGKYDRFLATLSAQDRAAFERYWTARTFHNAAADAYWGRVVSLRKSRRARLRKRQLVTQRNYVTKLPPKYRGPKVSRALWRRWTSFEARPGKPRKRRSLPNINDFLASARQHYGFTPERVSERTFKIRYASEALRLGLTKSQVIRVYALETGGIGTADMVAGIHPIRKTGRPISSALGYAQLLSANTLNMLQKHGKRFMRRLRDLRAQATTQPRRDRLTEKMRSLSRMIAHVNKLPRRWSYLQKHARTGKGRGVHAINVDGDIGPWIQVQKLRDTKGYALRAGRKSLTPEQLELMNLAGPATGLEMMTALGSQMPTSNFFSRRGYERNTIVRGKDGAGLLRALGERMDVNQKNRGAREFADIFDALLGRRLRQAHR
ncbi:MAG: hypothetical protein AAFQ45_12100 [Pseudomonadota bacterium]